MKIFKLQSYLLSIIRMKHNGPTLERSGILVMDRWKLTSLRLLLTIIILSVLTNPVTKIQVQLT